MSTTKYLKVKAPNGKSFTVSDGNSKVKFPIINTGAAFDCPSRAWCPFDMDNHIAAGRKLCYAQKTERLYTTALESRRLNAELIKEYNVALAHRVADALLGKLTAKRGKWSFDTVRINESGDLSKENILFVTALTEHLRMNGIMVYLYSKAPKSLRDRAERAGATVLHSERDFVAFKDEEELEKSGATKCSGICGPCKACPEFDGGKIGIIEH